MKINVKQNVKVHNMKIARYAKENAVKKAAQVIALIEKMGEKNPNI